MWLRVPFVLAVVLPLVALRTRFPDTPQVFVISLVAFGGARGLELLAQRSRYKIVIMFAAAGAALAVALVVRARLDAPATATTSAPSVKLPPKPAERPVVPNETLQGHWNAVALGDMFGAAISAEDGTVYTWNARPQPHEPLERAPEQLAGTDGAERVSIGFNHSCALRMGEAACWGWNFNGEIGRPSTGTHDRADSPVVAKLPVKLVDVAAGTGNTCAVDTDGAVWCWGGNENAECGVDGAQQVPPTRVADLPPAVAVRAGFHATCALTVEHRVMCWGDREFLGNGYGAKKFGAKPELVSGDLVVTSFGLGERGGCALDARGDMRCWGANMVASPTHVDGAVELAIGGSHACAIKADRTVVCWGQNWYGQLGDGTRQEAIKPVAVRDVRGVRSLAAGNNDTCAILDDGQLVCWGRFDHLRM